MATRRGDTLIFPKPPVIAAHACIGGKKEGESPLAAEFDELHSDNRLGQASWEAAETQLQLQTARLCLKKAHATEKDVSLLLAGDLQAQCTASGYAARALGLPFADKEHLTVLTDSSNKEPRQKELAEKYTPVVYLGDNLNDFQRKYYIKGDVPGRLAAMEADREEFGRRFILFPNPTDGHWMAAVFGESEPADTPEARAAAPILAGWLVRESTMRIWFK